MVGKQRNFGLDVVRAVSILLVLTAHRFTFNVELGIVGVQIFFILSGFLIGQILIHDLNTGGTFSTVLKFWKRRWYRTLPLYYMILVLKLIIYGNPYGLKILVYFFFLQANFVGIDFIPVSWSLVVEEWFYIFLPLAAFIFFSKGIKPKKLLFFIFGFIAFFFFARFFWNYFQKGVIIYQFDCLLLGVLLATVKTYYQSIYIKLNSFFLFAFGIAGIIFLTLLFGNVNFIPVYAAFYRVVWYFLISICISCIIPFIELSGFFNITLKKIRGLYLFFTWTSILTYSIYLVHAEVFLIRFNAPEIMIVSTQAVIIYLISFILYSLYEHPMMSLRERFSFDQYLGSVRSFSFKP